MSDEISSIHLFNQTNNSIPLDDSDLKTLADLIEKRESCKFKIIEAVLVDEDRIVEINKQFLNRDYVTDVISFRYDEPADNLQAIEGTLYCCWPRIQEQSKEFGETPHDELIRILIHGLLHLAGYQDQSTSEKKRMNERENHYLEQFKSL